MKVLNSRFDWAKIQFKCCRYLPGLIGVICCAGATAAPPQVFTLNPGSATDAYFEVNVSGTVFVAISAPVGQEPCADFWWIKWPLGNVESLGRKCNFVRFDTPGLGSFAISAKLRAGGAKSTVKLAISANEAAARSHTFQF